MFLEFVNKRDANSFFENLFSARDHAHKLHLNTKFYAQHKALNSFYEDLLDKIDGLIETYQGEYNLVNLSNGKMKFSEDPESFISNFANYVKDSRSLFEGDDHIQNMIDEITALSYQTLYKIRFLK